MKGRKPRQDELELWAKVASQTTPMPKALQSRQPSHHKKSDADRQTAPMTEHRFRPIAPSVPRADDLAPSLSQQLSNIPLQMDRKAYQKLKRGKLRPDAKIDLHGMTLERAHTALTRFVLSSHSSGKRLLLVVTGKGKNRDTGGPIPVRYGVLRHQVPEWLRLPPLSSAVLQVSQAHVSHGGGGAYYVYLRKAR